MIKKIFYCIIFILIPGAISFAEQKECKIKCSGKIVEKAAAVSETPNELFTYNPYFLSI